MYLAAFVPYIAAVVAGSRVSDRRSLAVILSLAVVFRLVMLPVRPTISTDVYRYVWDGRVANSGINPYRYVPGSPALRHLRNDNWHSINYPGTNTPYPPVSQLVFAGTCRLFGESVTALKSVLVIFDLASVVLLLLMLRTMRIPSGAVVAYAWSPLVVAEIAGAGHQDAIAVAFLLGALYLGISGRSLLSGCSLATSILTKPYALLVLPILVRRGGARLGLMAAAAGALLYLPYLSAEPRFLFAGASAYGGNWRGNESLFFLLDALCAIFTARHDHAARIIALAFAILLAALLALRCGPTPREQIRSAFIALAALMIVSPTLYPWYLVWTVPFLCFVRSPGWMLFTGSVALCYLLSPGGYPGWVRAAEYAPVYAILAISWLPSMRRSLALLTRRAPEDPRGAE